jgi:hypothetical protein
VTKDSDQRDSKSRAFSGLVLVFVLTILNFFGILLTMTALGGLQPWNEWQFLGLFGVVEAAAGASNVVAPNIWRLPVAEMETSHRTRVRFAATTMLIPHWGGAARSLAGLVLILVSGFHEGWSVESLLLLPMLLMLCLLFLAISAVIARWGVEYPDTDTMQWVVRWRSKEHELNPLSLSASLQQFVLGVITLPAVKILAPGVLFAPELRPSNEALLVTAAVTFLSIAATALLWAGRLQWQAPPEQQREAEQNA